MTTLSETRLKVYTQPDLSVKAAFCTRAVLNCSALTKADQSVWKKNKEKASESALRVISKPLPGEVTPRARNVTLCRENAQLLKQTDLVVDEEV